MKLGDVIEMSVNRKLAYLHLTYNHYSKQNGFWYGWFCRVLSGTFSKRPTSTRLRKAVFEPERFGCFYANVEDCVVVANITDHPAVGSFPICKQFIGVEPSPRVAWQFSNGVEERGAFRIPRDAANLPNLEIVNTSLIQERIEQGWTHSHDVPTGCIDPLAPQFRFSAFPLMSDFDSDRERFGDIFGFLASRGLFSTTQADVSIELFGIGPFENSAADHWLNSWDGKDGWSFVSSAIKSFIDSPDRNSTQSACAVAASGLILSCAGLLAGPKLAILEAFSSFGPVPTDLIRNAVIATIGVQQRSGLKETWAKDPRGPAWLELTAKMQLQLVELLIKRMK